MSFWLAIDGCQGSMLKAMLFPDKVAGVISVDNTAENVPLLPFFHNNLNSISICDLKISSNEPEKHVEKKMSSTFDSYDVINPIRHYLSACFSNKEKHVKFLSPVKTLAERDFLDKVGSWPHEEVEAKTFHKPALIIRSRHSGLIFSLDPFEKYFTN